MLEIQVKQSHWRRNFVIIIAILLMVAGGYIVLTALAPYFNAPLLTGKPVHETMQKLQKPPGAHGDRLYIPKINVNEAVVTGSDSSVLEKGAWHRKPQNGSPVDGGNFVLSAHRFVMSYTPQGTALKSPFYNIGKMAVGDKIFVDYQNQRYKYTVSKKYAVAPSASEIEAPTDEPRLTLYSCTLGGSGDGRDVIEATLES